jgi:hypothetical protein
MIFLSLKDVSVLSALKSYAVQDVLPEPSFVRIFKVLPIVKTVF